MSIFGEKKVKTKQLNEQIYTKSMLTDEEIKYATREFNNSIRQLQRDGARLLTDKVIKVLKNETIRLQLQDRKDRRL